MILYFCTTVLLSRVQYLSCNNRVRLNLCKYGTEGKFSWNSVHEAVLGRHGGTAKQETRSGG
jgi:hypothetical protein